MSTDRQIAANRGNAQKSTGFRTEDGKAASSGNAQRHRLTGALSTNTVLSWYCVILEDETAVADPFNQDFYFSAALDLAQAESHLHRVRKAEEEWLLGLKPTLAESERAYKDPRDLVLDTLLHVALFGKRLRMAREGRLLRQAFCRPADIKELHDVLEEHANDPTVRVGWDRKGFRLLRRIDRVIKRHYQKRQRENERQGRTLARYRATAEARRMALRHWIDEMTKRSQC